MTWAGKWCETGWQQHLKQGFSDCSSQTNITSEPVRMQIPRLLLRPLRSGNLRVGLSSLFWQAIWVTVHMIKFKNHWYRVCLWVKTGKTLICINILLHYNELNDLSPSSQPLKWASIMPNVWGWGQGTWGWVNDMDKQSFPRAWAHIPQNAARERLATCSKAYWWRECEKEGRGRRLGRKESWREVGMWIAVSS